MNTQPVVTDELNLDDVLAELGLAPDEIIESVIPASSAPVELTELEIEAAVRPLEPQEEVVEDSVLSEVIEDLEAPAPAAKPEKKKGKGKSKKAASAEPKEKKEKTPRKFYASKVERVTDKLGAELGNYTVLTMSDATKTGDDLDAVQKATLEKFKAGAIGIKVQNRMTLLLEFVAGKSSKLNEVIERAFRVLQKDGFIKSGEKGNLHADLMTKYSLASARAMGNNTIACMRELAVIVKGEDGNYVANPDSLVLMKTNSLLGL